NASMRGEVRSSIASKIPTIMPASVLKATNREMISPRLAVIWDEAVPEVVISESLRPVHYER
ncbi:MAG: hypothetical protein P8Z30_09335, partial [Acidobacteriota bacterium]